MENNTHKNKYDRTLRFFFLQKLLTQIIYYACVCECMWQEEVVFAILKMRFQG